MLPVIQEVQDDPVDGSCANNLARRCTALGTSSIPERKSGVTLEAFAAEWHLGGRGTGSPVTCGSDQPGINV